MIWKLQMERFVSRDLDYECLHFSSGIVERAKRERAWKSPHARKGDTFLSPRRVSPFLAWGDFHARSRFAHSTIPEEKWGLLVVYTWLKYPSVVRWICYFLLLLAHFALSRGLRPRAAPLFSYSVEQNARDTKVTTRVTEGAIRERPPLACALACTPLTKSEEKERLFAVYCELLFTANFDFSLLDSWCHQKISIMKLWNKLSRQN